jgi:lipoprotein-releasing system ATP-binding protein
MSNQTANIVLEAKGVTKTYGEGATAVEVLRGLDLQVKRGESLAILGQSGSGKSTLLHILSGLDAPSAGSVSVRGTDMRSLNEKTRGDLRNKALGFVYQFHHLLPEFSALENVQMPLSIRGLPPQQSATHAKAMLDAVGLAHRITHRPGELSGGERQRVALARALVTEPDCLLADEPTGNLDSDNANGVFELIMSMQKRLGTALVLVTHDRELAARCDRSLTLKSGMIAT